MKLTKPEIVELEVQLVSAIKKRDLEFLENALHNDLLFIAPGGQVVTKAMDLAAHAAGNMVVEELEPAIEQITIIEDIAIAVVVYETRGTMMGNRIDGKFRYIRTWKRFDGATKVIAGSCTMI